MLSTTNRPALLASTLGLALIASAAPAKNPASSEEFETALVLPTDPERLESSVAALVNEVVAEGAVDPRRAAAHAKLGMVYEANNLWPEARDSYRRSIELEPPGKALWRLHEAVATREAGDPALALELLRALAKDAPDLAPMRQRLGEALLETGDLAGAKREFEHLIALRPRAPEGPTGLANTLLRERRHAEAAALLEKAIDLDPSYRVPHYLLGVAYRALGRREEAEHELALGAGGEARFLPDPLSDEIATYAVHLTARLAAADAHLRSGRAPEAVGVLEAAFANHPQSVTVMNNLAIAYMRTGRLDRARKVLSSAREIEDSRFSTWINLAICALRMGRLDEALASADGAVARAPHMDQTHLTRANVLGARGEFAEALVSLARAAELGPGNLRTQLMMGDVLLRLGRPAEAADSFRRASELAPGALPAYLGLTDALIEQGQFEGAEVALETARALAPGHPRLEDLEGRLEARRKR